MHFRYQSGQQKAEVALDNVQNSLRAVVNGIEYRVEILDRQPGILNLQINGQPQTFYWAQDGARKWISQGGCTYWLDPPAPHQTASEGGETSAAVIRAPMPAQVMAVQVAAGDPVERGQVLLLLEAMKMEIQVRSPAAGRAARVLAAAGQTVDRDQILVEIGG